MSIEKKRKKHIANVLLFFIIMILTFYTVLHGQDWTQIWKAISQLSMMSLIQILLTALFFVCAEGWMIWYLLRAVNPGGSRLTRCISYSFIGFFYSGITPSATGGQPVQLYYMKKDGNALSDSSVVLMTVALIYKFVLVLIGSAMLIFWSSPLKKYLQRYFALYLFGLFLNVVLVAVLLAVMLLPDGMKRIVSSGEAFLIRRKLLKESDVRREKMTQFIDGYRDAVRFLAGQKKRVAIVVLVTFFQRTSVFLLTAFVYRGFSLEGTSLITVMLLQASVTVAVDMLPLPGAQGITEWMYCNVFHNVFTGAYLMPSLYVTRGVQFYFLLLVSLAVVAGNQFLSSCFWKMKNKY